MRPGYKRTEVGEIPEDWGVAKLEALTICLDSLRVPLNESQRATRRGDVPYCGANGVLDYVDDFVVDDEIILIAEDGGHFEEHATRPIAYRMSGRCWVNNHAHILKAKAPFDQTYIFYSLVHKDILRYLASGTRAKLNRSELNKIELPSPRTRGEQRAIAEALEGAASLVESMEQLLAKKRAIKQGAMQALLTGAKRLPGFTRSWDRRRLGEIAGLSKATIDPAASPDSTFVHFSLPAYDAGTGPCVEVGASIGSHKLIVPPNAVLLSKLNPRIPRAWMPELIPPNSVCSTEFLVLVPREGTSRAFLKATCSSSMVCAQMELHAIGTTGSHQRIHPGQALKIEIDCPPTWDEQLAIAEVLADMDADIDATTERLAKARAIKQGMMQELLSGRIRLL